MHVHTRIRSDVRSDSRHSHVHVHAGSNGKSRVRCRIGLCRLGRVSSGAYLIRGGQGEYLLLVDSLSQLVVNVRSLEQFERLLRCLGRFVLGIRYLRGRVNFSISRDVEDSGRRR